MTRSVIQKSQLKLQKAQQQNISAKKSILFEKLNFIKIDSLAKEFANYIEANTEQITNILLEYESFEVVQDEIARTLDLLKNLKENKDFFTLRIGEVAAFLPRNQPLYALTCFVIVPSLMATEVHFRIPQSMKHFFPRLIKAIRLEYFFTNIIISRKERLKFLKERSALRINPKTEESTPVTDVVIFTGTSSHAEKLRLVFDKRTLFIANGSGHNPVVISEDADIPKAVDAVLTLQLYNQGQDCAAPNSILVHSNAVGPFMRLLREELKKVHVGHYEDRHCRVGPISDPEDLLRIQQILVENRQWLDPSTPGIIRTSTAIVEPVIICKPLQDGGNYKEVFAPIIFIQQYSDDSDLSLYFEHSQYAINAMYVTYFGTSQYLENIVGKIFYGKVLHEKETVLHDNHLHAFGVERGTQPYGGYGYAASSLSINGKIIAKPTLPQRDIYEWVVKPILSSDKIQELTKLRSSMTEILNKDVRKLLGLKKIEEAEKKHYIQNSVSYIDALDIIASDRQRYIEFLPDKMFTLLSNPNIEHIASMEPKHVKHIRTLHKLLSKNMNINLDEFTHLLYSIPKKPDASDKENKSEQLAFFKNIYQLLIGKESGPRIAPFLMDANRQYVLDLLNI